MRCKSINEQGVQCTLKAGRDSQFCWFHDPKLAQRRFDAQSRGGRGRRRKRQVVYDIKFNLKDLHQIPFVLDESLNLALHKVITLDELEAIRKQVESALKACKLLSIDVKVDELLSRLDAERDRPVNQGEFDNLLNFAPDEVGAQNADDPGRLLDGPAKIGGPANNVAAELEQDIAEILPHPGDAQSGAHNVVAEDGQNAGDAGAEREDLGESGRQNDEG